MADQLRMEAVVGDGFSAPLRRLNSLLDQTAKHPAGKWVKNEWNGVRESFDKITSGLNSGLSPALTRVGVTSLSVGGAVAGIGAAIKSFATSTRDLNQFSKSIGMSVDQLREMRAVGEHFGVSWDQAQGSLKTFQGNLDQVRRRWGETYGALRAMNLGELAEKLVAAPNMQAAVETAIEGLKSIQNPVRRREVAELLFGSDQWATVASQLTPSLRRAIKDAMGEIPAGSAEAAEAFAVNWTKMGLSVERFRNEAIGPLLGDVNEVFSVLNRPATYTAIKEQWDSLTSRVRNFATGISSIMELAKALRSGDWEKAGQSLGSGAKSLGRLGLPGAFGLIPEDKDEAQGITSLQDKIRELEERRAANDANPLTRGRVPERQAELTREIEKLTAELKRLRENGGATVQKQSFGGGGGFGLGGLIQNASFGGGGMGSAGGSRFGYGAGFDPSGGAGRGRSGSLPPQGDGGGPGADAPVPRVSPAIPGQNGPRSLFGEMPVSGASGRYRPEYKLGEADTSQRVIDTIASEARLKTPGGADAVINNMLNRVGSKGWGPSRNLLDVSQAPGQYEGAWKGRRATGAESEFIRSRISAIASGEVPDNTEGSNSFRASWYRGPWWKRYGQFGKDVGGNTFANQPEIPNGPYAPYSAPRAVVQAATTRPGDSMMGRAFGPGGVTAGAPKMEATGAVNIHLSGGLEKSPARVSMEGLFKDVQVNRGRQMDAAN